MGGGKETPRQKMIGLMYLVLMAMLAMNVSKEIINAFVTLDRKMEDGNQLTMKDIYGKVSTAEMALEEMKLDPAIPPAKIEKQKDLIDRLHHVVDMSKRTANYMVDRTSYMIMQADPASADLARTLGHYGAEHHNDLVPDKDGAQSYYYVDERGYYHLASMMHLAKKDDYDTPTRLFVGDNFQSPVEGGLEILSTLKNFRDSLIAEIANYDDIYKGEPKTWNFPEVTATLNSASSEDQAVFDAAITEALATVNPADSARIKQIYKILTPVDFIDNHGETQPWLAGVFNHSPIVASGALFTSLKGDVQRAESIAIAMIADKTEKPKFNFNKIEPLAFANKGYINQGDSLGLSVMIAAYDSTQDLKLRYWEEDSTRSGDPILFEGEATRKLGLGGNKGAGKHYVYGEIEVEENGGKKWKKWEFDYTVGTPTGVVANTEMNVLYINYDNQIQASGSGYPSVEASCSGCSLSKKGDGNYIATVKTGKKATIVVTGIAADGKKAEIARQEFRIKRLPSPTPVIVGAGVSESTVSIGKIKQAKKLLAELKGSPLNVKFNVTKFTISVVKNGEVAEAKCKGSRLSSKALNYLKGLKKGQKLYIEDVWAQGPKGKPKKIPSLIFKVL